MRGAQLILAIVGALAAVLVVALIGWPFRKPSGRAARAAAPARTSIDAPVIVPPPETRAIVVGGGAEPESSGVQLEQDTALAASVLGPNAYVLFGAGRGPTSVRLLGEEAETDDVRALLAELFDPRDRGARYRPTTLTPSAPATKQHLLEALAALSSHEGPPLTLFVAAHGGSADDPADATIDLWSGDVLYVADLTSLHAASRRPIVSVITSCYGGAFAETALDHEATITSCGLFATTHDRVASGCDANPERGAQEGFALHFFGALRGTDRAGHALDRATLDLDRDGRISYLEAHAHARIASRGFDVPTTTSERLLRALTTDRELDVDALAPSDDPIEARVVAVLGQALDAHEIAVARAVLARIGDELAGIEDESLAAEEARDAAYRRLRIVLLERWPFLDDPWHPEHAALLAREGSAIAAAIEGRAELRAYRDAGARMDALASAYDEKLVEESRALRLVRAMENLRMITAVRTLGGDGLARYEALRACERGP